MKVVRGLLKLVVYLCVGIGILVALAVFSPKARDKILAWAEKLLDKLDRPAKPELADEDEDDDDDDDDIDVDADEAIAALVRECPEFVEEAKGREYYSLTDDDFYEDDLD